MDQLFRTITVRLSRPRWIDWLVLKINGSIKIKTNLMKMNVCVERLYRTLTDDWKCLPVALDPGDVTVRCGPTFIKTRPMYEFRIVFNDKLSYNEAHNTTWHSAGPKRMPNGISRRFSICSGNPSLLAISRHYRHWMAIPTVFLYTTVHWYRICWQNADYLNIHEPKKG